MPWDGKGPPCQSSAAVGGSAIASHGQLISLENQFTDHVGRFANERIPPHRCAWLQGYVRTRDDVALNSLLRASFILSFSCLDLKQPEMGKLRVSF